LSDGSTPRRVTSGQTRQRRRGAARGGRHGLSRPVAILPTEDPVELAESAQVAAPARPRRAPVERMPPAAGLSREAEYAYIRADMRRLLIIAAALMALMFVILVLVDR